MGDLCRSSFRTLEGFEEKGGDELEREERIGDGRFNSSFKGSITLGNKKMKKQSSTFGDWSGG